MLKDFTRGEIVDGKQYEQLRFPEEDPQVIKLSELSNRSFRTLAYGYTSDRATWHLYLNKQRQFVLIVYRLGYEERFEAPEYVVSYDEELPIRDIFSDLSREVQAVRLYPESCDFEFMKKLQYMGVELPFTKFDPIRFDKVKDLIYHGKLEENDRRDNEKGRV